MIIGQPIIIGGGDADFSQVTATRHDVLPDKKFYDANGNLVTGQMETWGGGTYTPTTHNLEFDPPFFLTGMLRILGDANLISNNIALGKSIFNVDGSCPRYGHKSEAIKVNAEGAPVQSIRYDRQNGTGYESIVSVILHDIEFTPTHASIWCWKQDTNNIIKLATTYAGAWNISDKSLQYKTVTTSVSSGQSRFDANVVTLPLPLVSSLIIDGMIYYTVTGYYAS